MNDAQPRVEGVERALQFPHLVFFDVGSFYANATQRKSHVKEILARQLQLVVEDQLNLADDVQAILYLFDIGLEGNLVNALRA